VSRTIHEATDLRAKLLGYLGFVGAAVTFVMIAVALGLGSVRPSLATWVEEEPETAASLISTSQFYVSQFTDKTQPSLAAASHKGWIDRYNAPRVGVPSTSMVATAASYANELRCLTEAIYYEARSEQVTGRFAVAEVVLNRVRDNRYPNTICDVVYQGPMDGRPRPDGLGCQFSFTCDGSLNHRVNLDAWRYSRELAKLVMFGMGTKLTSDATHYHADYVDPYWAPTLERTVRIGRHIFYRWHDTRKEANNAAG